MLLFILLSDYHAFHHIELRDDWQDELWIVKVLTFQRNKNGSKGVLQQCKACVNSRTTIFIKIKIKMEKNEEEEEEEDDDDDKEGGKEDK